MRIAKILIYKNLPNTLVGCLNLTRNIRTNDTRYQHNSAKLRTLDFDLCYTDYLALDSHILKSTTD